MMRVGLGYDLHRLVPGRPCILGGVHVPSDCGPLGHSDGDVLAHAVTDALFGALAMGDIGHHFPDTDPQYKDADSMELLRQAWTMIAAQHYEIGNIDANIIVDKPRLADYLSNMAWNIASCLRCDTQRVSIKARTHEGLGPEGTGEAIQAQAIVLLLHTPDQRVD